MNPQRLGNNEPDDPNKGEKGTYTKLDNDEFLLSSTHSHKQLATKEKDIQDIKKEFNDQAETSTAWNDQTEETKVHMVESTKELNNETAIDTNVPGRSTDKHGSVSKSGNWLAAKDSEGNVYYYHRVTRQAVWVLPEGEKSENVPITETKLKTLNNSGMAVAMERRAEFKKRVSDLAAKLIEAYRKRFFPSNNEYVHFIRKITHIVLDNQDKAGNRELVFNDSVSKSTKRLMDEYIRLFKARNSSGSSISAGHQHQPPSSSNSVISILNNSVSSATGDEPS